MNARSVLVTSLLLAPLFASSRAPATLLRFAPAEGSSVKKTFETKLRLTLDELSIDGPASVAPPRMEMTVNPSQRLVVEDEYVKMRDGAPATLERSYDEIAGDVSATMSMEILDQKRDSDQTLHATSELEGKRVRFQWNAEKGEYDARFEPTLDKPALLEGLAEDLDLRTLLPDHEVEIGDSWKIPAKELVPVLAPGGNLSLVSETSGATSMKLGAEMQSLSGLLGSSLEGEATAKLEAVREQDGVKLAIIRLDIEVRSTNDLTEMARKALEDIDLPPEVEKLVLDELEVEYSFEGDGELVWDLSAGRFATLSISGQAGVESNEKMSVTFDGKTIAVGQHRSLSGTSSISAKAE